MPFHTATEAFRTGKDTPRDYLERCLHTISDREPTVRAWAALNEDGAREQADRSSARWRDGTPLSPIDGLPIGIKDLLETKDMPTQMGCEAYTGNFPARDNAAVWALRAAGAVIVGKTVTAELGGSHPGPTTNPFDPARTPGGSSSGSAAAVGAGMVPAAIGTQVGGSIIRPASYCGNWALKPSQGAINRGERQTTSMSTHGVHATCAEDMWLIAVAIATRAGGDPGHAPLSGPATPPASHRPFSLGVMETEGWPGLDTASREAFEEFLDRLAATGVPVLRRTGHAAIERFEQELVGVRDVTTTITAWENQWWLRDLVARNPDGVSPRGKAGLDVAEKLGLDGYQDLLRRRERVRRRHAALAADVDVLLSLASPGSAPLWSGDVPGEPLAPWPTGDAVFNTPSSLVGATVVTVPLLTVGGLPVGVQVMGQPGTDARATAIARWLAETTRPVAA
ncbi:amidase [Actinomadura madurae]|uniref:amidase n=1 Tax=Actinomadura madurae TaxID=1993 RepID=UPI0020D23412|nr:amidase [Actinomadura madurae]MCP9955706.1 amidase [Actinomadura madurae]MCP9984951.1 amidase [Actinomadura madurae]MCQ0003490.1 amidase [Actinomadura madurae]MCQ0021147.1 amidase [Actinomadura madurae]